MGYANWQSVTAQDIIMLGYNMCSGSNTSTCSGNNSASRARHSAHNTTLSGLLVGIADYSSKPRMGQTACEASVNPHTPTPNPKPQS